jgi:hypothetical protein
MMRKKNYQKMVGLMVSDKTYIELVRFTDEMEVSVSAFIRSLLEERLHERRKDHDKA